MHMLKEAGYQDLDLHFCDADKGTIEICGDDWERWANNFRNEMERLGLTCGQSHAPYYKRGLIPADKAVYKYSEKMVRRSIEAAGIIGAKTITIHGNAVPGCVDFEQSKALNLEYFCPLLELAEKCGVSIAIENMFDPYDPIKTTIRRRRYLAYVPDLIDLVDTLGKDFKNVGICWDFGHANEMSWNQVESLKMIGKRLIATHVNDNYGIKDDHLLPYLGEIEWKPIMKTLRDIKYEGNFTYETRGFTVNLPDELIPEALRFSVILGNYLLSLA